MSHAVVAACAQRLTDNNYYGMSTYLQVVWLLVLLSIASLIKTLLRRTGRAILRYNVLYILPATAPLLVGVIGDLLMDVVYACAILAAVSRTTRCVVCVHCNAAYYCYCSNLSCLSYATTAVHTCAIIWSFLH
jgi:hypothetical protein